MTEAPRRILFVTGTRADFGKLQPLIQAVEDMPEFECIVFVTGMHTLETYGYTVTEVQRCGFKNIHVYMNQMLNEPMDLVLANSIAGLSRFIHENPPDMMVVHGDRIEALAGAAVGALRNTLTAHIEGGELSGTVDELIRHAVTKLAHIHFVANEDAAQRLRQMGEQPDSIFVIGSPDIDVMISPNLPSLEHALSHYQIPFKDYAIALFHPVTTEVDHMRAHSRNFVDAILECGDNFIAVNPNNDEGAVHIMQEYERLNDHPRFRVFPSVRFELFLSLLKNAKYIVGNSSVGVREAPFYGRYAVNVGSRQTGRFNHSTIIDTDYTKDGILRGIAEARSLPPANRSTYFGDGKSRDRFVKILKEANIFSTPRQKKFIDVLQIPAVAE